MTAGIAYSFKIYKKTVFFKTVFLLYILNEIDFFKTRDKQRKSAEPLSDKVQRNAGGSGWIRTTEAKRNRFTVCPLWPLGNAPRYLIVRKNWSWWTDSNPRPADYKSAALPTELYQHGSATDCMITEVLAFVNGEFQKRY